MIRRIWASAIGVAALFVVAADACAAAGHGGHAMGFASPHWGPQIHHRCSAGFGCRAFAHRFFRRIPNTAFADGGWYYDSYGDLEPVDDSGVNPVDVVPVPVPVAHIRSNCHLQTKSYVVPAEAGGERKVAVTRCVSDTAFASGAPGPR